MKRQNFHEIDESEGFQKDAVVWAKILGWPWWPAQISEIPCKKNRNYKVEFLGDISHAFLPEEKLMDYEDGRDKHSIPKGHHKNFSKALVIAEKLLETNQALKEESRTESTSSEKPQISEIKLINSKEQQSNEKIEILESTNTGDCSNKLVGEKILLETQKLKLKNKQVNKSRMNKCERICEKLEDLIKRFKLENIKLPENSAKEAKKRKLISKAFHNESYENSFKMKSKIAKTICKVLSSKGISINERYNISIFLTYSFFEKKENNLSGLHRALFQWINSNDGETIVENYKLWPKDSKTENCTDCF